MCNSSPSREWNWMSGQSRKQSPTRRIFDPSAALLFAAMLDLGKGSLSLIITIGFYFTLFFFIAVSNGDIWFIYFLRWALAGGKKEDYDEGTSASYKHNLRYDSVACDFNWSPWSSQRFQAVYAWGGRGRFTDLLPPLTLLLCIIISITILVSGD